MPHEFDSRDRPAGEPGPIRPTAALHRLARLLDGRARNIDDIEEIAEILRRAGYTVRSPEEIKVRCPNCGGPDSPSATTPPSGSGSPATRSCP